MDVHKLQAIIEDECAAGPARRAALAEVQRRSLDDKLGQQGTSEDKSADNINNTSNRRDHQGDWSGDESYGIHSAGKSEDSHGNKGRHGTTDNMAVSVSDNKNPNDTMKCIGAFGKFGSGKLAIGHSKLVIQEEHCLC